MALFSSYAGICRVSLMTGPTGFREPMSLTAGGFLYLVLGLERWFLLEILICPGERRNLHGFGRIKSVQGRIGWYLWRRLTQPGYPHLLLTKRWQNWNFYRSNWLDKRTFNGNQCRRTGDPEELDAGPLNRSGKDFSPYQLVRSQWSAIAKSTGGINRICGSNLQIVNSFVHLFKSKDLKYRELQVALSIDLLLPVNMIKRN